MERWTFHKQRNIKSQNQRNIYHTVQRGKLYSACPGTPAWVKLAETQPGSSGVPQLTPVSTILFLWKLITETKTTLNKTLSYKDSEIFIVSLVPQIHHQRLNGAECLNRSVTLSGHLSHGIKKNVTCTLIFWMFKEQYVSKLETKL